MKRSLVLVLVLDWTQCLPQGVDAPPAMLRGRTAGFHKKTGWPGLQRGGVVGYNLHSPPDCGTPTTSRLYPFGAAYNHHVVVVIDLPLLRVAVEGSDNPVSLEKPCQASLPPDQQGRHSLGRHPEVQYVA